MTIRVLVADAHAAARAGFCLLIDSAPDMRVVGDAADGDAVVALASTTEPDVVLMDTHLPGTDGLEATRRITSHPLLAGVRVLIFTIYDDDEHLFRALAAGASGFLPVDTDPEDLRSAIRAIAAGEAWLNPRHTRRVIDEFTSGTKTSVPTASVIKHSVMAELSNREQEVFALVGQGLTNAEIAERLHLSPLTAKTYVSRIMTKLGARDRIQLVVTALGSGAACHGVRCE
ncbi:response regulator transcription factor [Nocardia altamirensis]|uniref:response regulator transcription factor n=1 Tax=Nocardia altamirensis TaxID=472158 RepID=UPI00083FEA56|nr:response regulator transcription factor [Nocardia altamirensis]